MEQRICLKFCVANQISFTNSFRMLQKAYGENCISRTSAYEWFRKFKEGRESVEDDPRSGRPSTSTDDAHIEKVRELILKNRQYTVREIADEVGISFGSCQHILSHVLDGGKRKKGRKRKNYNIYDMSHVLEIKPDPDSSEHGILTALGEESSPTAKTKGIKVKEESDMNSSHT